MKTYLRTITATLALAGSCIAGAALPVQAGAPRAFQASQVAPDDSAGQQPAPLVTGGQAYGPYADPAGYGPAMGPYGCGPGDGPGRCALNPVALARAAEWRFAADAVLLQRGSPGAQPLLRNGFGLTSAQVFNARDFHFGTAAGFSASATRSGGLGFDLELKYTHINSFKAAKVFAENVFLETDANGANFTVTNAAIENTSELHSAEANLWGHVGERVRLLTGFRWLEWNDRYELESIGTRVAVPVTFSNLAFNSLYGVQIGGDVNVIEWGRLTVNWGVKTGGYGNASSQRSHQVDTGFVDQSLDAHGPHTAFSCEMDAMATVELIFSRLYFRAGYEILYLDGVLLAPDQIAVNDFSRGTAGLRYGSVFNQGGYAGFELRF